MSIPRQAVASVWLSGCHVAQGVCYNEPTARTGRFNTMKPSRPLTDSTWFNWLPYTDSITHRQAMLIRTLRIAVSVISFFGAFVTFLAPLPFTNALVIVGVVWANIPVTMAGLWLLYRGRFQAALLLTCIGLIAMLSFLLITTGSRDGGALLFGFALPIVLAGLLADRRVLALIIGLSGAGITLTILLERTSLPLIGIAAPQGENLGGILGGFLVIALILGVFVSRFGQALRTALQEAQQRTQTLELLQAAQEQTIAERTVALSTALTEVQARAATQAQLLDENAQQRSIIQELSVPVLPISHTTMVIPLVGALDTQRLLVLQERALYAIQGSRVRRLLLDVSAVPLIDSQVAQGLLDVTRQVRLLGAEAILVGIRPEVAQALVALGVDLQAMRTYRDLEAALHYDR